MTIKALVQPFLHLGLFRGLKPLQITEIARRAERVVYRPGDVIIAEDAVADAAVLIVVGDAVRVSGPELSEPAERIPPGSLVGEMAMLVETTHSSTVVARGTVRALRIARSEMHAQMAADPSLADHFVQKISARLSRLAEELRLVDRILAGTAAAASNPVARPLTSEPSDSSRGVMYH